MAESLMEKAFLDQKFLVKFVRMFNVSRSQYPTYENAILTRLLNGIPSKIGRKDESMFIWIDKTGRIFSYIDLVDAWCEVLDKGEKVSLKHVIEWTIKKWDPIAEFGKEYDPKELLTLARGDCGLCVLARLEYSKLITHYCTLCKFSSVVMEKLGFHPCYNITIPGFTRALKRRDTNNAIKFAQQFQDYLYRFRDNNWEDIIRRCSVIEPKDVIREICSEGGKTTSRLVRVRI